MNNDALLCYYGLAEIALYSLVAFLVTWRARSAWSAYETTLGWFLLWAIPAMLLDSAIGRDVPGIGYLIVAPFYAAASPVIYAVTVRVRPRRSLSPDPDFAAPDSSPMIRFLAMGGRVAGRVVRVLLPGRANRKCKH
jgi:hypothetical protein